MFRRRQPRDLAEPADTGAAAIVTEALGLPPVLFELSQQLPQQRYDLTPRHQILQHEVETITEGAAADEKRILVPAAADDADFALVGAGAAIRAAGHTDADPLLLQPQRLQFRFECIDDPRQCP